MTLALVTCAVATLLLLAAEKADWPTGRAVAKLTASTMFVTVAVLAGAAETTYGLVLLAGLVLCWLGDAFLLPDGRSAAFQIGIGSFLLGHLAFGVAFLSIGVEPIAFVTAAIVVAGLAVWVLRWLGPHVPDDFRVPVRAYIVVIGLMVTLSVSAVFAGAPLVVVFGAVGFAVSDVSVARDRFVTPSFSNGAWGLPLYFGSQLLLAYSPAMLAAA
jgi:uncharacterized membrane protein YhhN